MKSPKRDPEKFVPLELADALATTQVSVRSLPAALAWASRTSSQATACSSCVSGKGLARLSVAGCNVAMLLAILRTFVGASEKLLTPYPMCVRLLGP